MRFKFVVTQLFVQPGDLCPINLNKADKKPKLVHCSEEAPYSRGAVFMLQRKTSNKH